MLFVLQGDVRNDMLKEKRGFIKQSKGNDSIFDGVWITEFCPANRSRFRTSSTRLCPKRPDSGSTAVGREEGPERPDSDSTAGNREERPLDAPLTKRKCSSTMSTPWLRGTGTTVDFSRGTKVSGGCPYTIETGDGRRSLGRPAPHPRESETSGEDRVQV